MLRMSGSGGIVASGDPWVNLDGRLNAPPGAPQYPHGLDLTSGTQSWGVGFTGSSYVTRPPWKVSGVDYAVGIRPNISLQDPFSSYTNATTGTLVVALQNIGGVFPSPTAGSQIIEFSGSSANNATVSGYDFSLHGGVGIEIHNCSNFTLTDCNFFNGATLIANTATMVSLFGASVGVIEAQNVTIQYCVIDGNKAGGTYLIGFGSIEDNSLGSHSIKYCWIKNAYAENIVYGVNLSTASNVHFNMQYNIIEGAGYGFAGGAHGDWIQLVNSNSGAAGGPLASANFSFNLWLQKELAGGGGTQGLSLMTANETQSETDSVNVSNNTFIALAANCTNEFTRLNNTVLNGSATNNQNYMDNTGLGTGGTPPTGWYWLFDGSGSGFNGGFNGTISGFGNINIVTGATITPADSTRGNS